MMVEALISMALLATVLGLTLTTIGRARRHADLNNARLEALHLARQKMEEIRQRPYDSTNNLADLRLGKTNTVTTNKFTYTYFASSNNYFGTNFSKDVTLTVTYVGALSQTTTVTLVTSMNSALHQ